MEEIDEDCLVLAKKFLKESPLEGNDEKTAELAADIELSIAAWISENTD